MVTELIEYLEELKKEHGKWTPYYTFSDDKAKIDRIIKIVKEAQNDKDR